MQIRRLRPGDEGRLQEISQLYYDHAMAEGEAAQILSGDHNFLLAIIRGNKVAAYLLAFELPQLNGQPKMMMVQEIATVPGYRRRGMARLLLEEIRRHARSRGASRLFAVTQESNKQALGLIRSAGGRRTAVDDVVFELIGEQDFGRTPPPDTMDETMF